MAFADRHMESIYLLTDGKPDTSTGMVLKRVEDMNDDRNVVINTISFQCDDRLVKLLCIISTTLNHVLVVFNELVPEQNTQ